MIYTYEHNGETYTVQLQLQGDGRYLATVGGNTYKVSVTKTADGGMVLQWDGGRKHVYTANADNERYVHVDGQSLTFTVPAPQSKRRRASGGAGDLTVQMPGAVVEVLVQAGDAVESGQTLVILEAMKMEIRVTAPGAGTVKKIFVQKGETVDRGQRLIELSE